MTQRRYEPNGSVFDVAMWLVVLFPLALVALLTVALG